MRLKKPDFAMPVGTRHAPRDPRSVPHWIDTSVAPMHPRIVELLLRRTAAFVVALAFAAAGWAECAGWHASPEERMACCSGVGDCPMHGSTKPGAGPESGITQAQADSCCAASETNDSTPSAAIFSLSLSALVNSTVHTLAPIMAPPSLFDAWRPHEPLPRGHVPKYVLLSVFLI
jgi:hypothetical protein